jgi:hypothetical protein
MPEVVRQRRGVDDVGVAAERLAELTGHLGDLEGVGQPVAHEVVEAWSHDLRLRREATQRRGVHDAPPVALERCPSRPFGWLVDEPLARLVAVRTAHRICFDMVRLLVSKPDVS